jgi:5-methylcytosine-specific restriction endonuclease McrA
MANLHKVCIVCQTEFIPNISWQKSCSYECGYKHQNQKRYRAITNHKKCARCNVSLEGKKSHAIYCSKTCKSMDHTFKHRSKTRTTSTARRNKIYNRDNQKCYICLNFVNFKDFELDHLVPVSRGGSGEPNNLAVTCRRCNRSKGSKIDLLQLSKLFELRNYGSG